jgi:hypothetical protein
MIFLSINIFAQSNWSINKSLKISTDIISQIEKSGYIIKALTVGNNKLADNISISSSLKDTIYVIAIMTKQNISKSGFLGSSNNFSLSIYSNNDLQHPSKKDTLIKAQSDYVETISSVTNEKNYIWKTFIAPPTNSSKQYHSFKIIFSRFFSNEEYVLVPNQKGIEEGDTAEKFAKRMEYRQCMIIAFSKS